MLYRDGKKIDSPEESEEDMEDSGEESTLIPKSLLPKGAKVGDEVKLKIVHGFEGEFEVQYSSSHSDSNNDKSEDEQPPQEKETFEEISADA